MIERKFKKRLSHFLRYNEILKNIEISGFWQSVANVSFPEEAIEEKVVFHGTRRQCIESIIDKGFDEKLATHGFRGIGNMDHK